MGLALLHPGVEIVEYPLCVGASVAWNHTMLPQGIRLDGGSAALETGLADILAC